MFTLAISRLTTSNSLPTHGPNIPGSYAILFFTALDFTSITSHIHNWVLFLLWLCVFILSGVISPLFSSSILGTYQPGSSSFSVISFCLFSRKSRDTWSNRQIWPRSTNEAGQRLTEFCQENALIIANTLFQQHKRRLYIWTSPDSQYRNQTDYILCSQRWRSYIQSAKTRPGADCGSDYELLPYCQIQTSTEESRKNY